MASNDQKLESSLFEPSEEENSYDTSDSTTVDDSYLASLSERMAESKPPSGPDPSPAVPQSQNDSLSPFNAEAEKPTRPPVAQTPSEMFKDPFSVPPTASEDQSTGSPDGAKTGQSPPPGASPTSPPGPSDLLRTVPPPPEEPEQIDPELDPATYDAPTFVRPSLIDQDPVPVVEVLQGNESGRSYRIEKDSITLGRSLENDIVLTDIAVSRRHSRLIKQGTNVFAEDLGSGNGTVINGIRTPRSPLNASDRIEIGNTIFRVVFPGQGSVPPIAAQSSAAAFPNAILQSSPGHYPPEIGAVMAAPSPPGMQQPYVPMDPMAANLQRGVSQTHPVGFPGQAASVQVQPQVLVAPQLVEQSKSSSRNMRIAMTILAVGMLVIGAVAIVAALIQIQGPADSPSGVEGLSDQMTGDELLSYSTKAFEAQRWSQTIGGLERLTALEPANEKASKLLKRARAEENHMGTLEAGRQALQDKNYQAAVTTLAMIPRSSIYSPQSIELKSQAEDRWANSLVAKAQQIAQEDPEESVSLLDKALELAPANSEARTLRREISKGNTENAESSEEEGLSDDPEEVEVAQAPRRTGRGRRGRRTPVETKNQSTPTAAKSQLSSGQISSVLSHYKNGNFGNASSAAKELAASAQSDQEKRRARQLSSQIDRFAKSWRGSKSTSDQRQRRSYLESALKLDRQISNGYYAGQIRSKLREVYVSTAQRGWSAGQYKTACSSAIAALRIDRGASQAAAIASKCESKAREFYQQGERLQSTDLNAAKSNFRKVINMVPRSSPLYSKAYSALNNAGRRRIQDEDE